MEEVSDRIVSTLPKGTLTHKFTFYNKKIYLLGKPQKKNLMQVCEYTTILTNPLTSIYVLYVLEVMTHFI